MPHEGFIKFPCRFYRPLAAAEAHLVLGDNATARQRRHAAIAVRGPVPVGGLDERRLVNDAHTLESMALARLGRMADARTAVEPQLAFEHDLASRNPGDATQCFELAQMRYVASLSDPALALRREALALIDRQLARTNQMT